MKRFMILILVLGGIVLGYTQSKNSEGADKTASQQISDVDPIKIYVNKKGKIFANEKKITLTDLDQTLAMQKEKNGGVYYSRANTAGEPPAESMQVIKLVIKHKLPIRFFTDRSFTTPAKVK